MSQENVGVVRGALDAFNRRDRSAWLALVAPELEWVPPADWPENATVRGREAVWEFFVAVNEPWAEGTMELIELIDCENDVVAAHVGRHVRGKASGVEAEFEWWGVFTFSNGKLLRSEMF